MHVVEIKPPPSSLGTFGSEEEVFSTRGMSLSIIVPTDGETCEIVRLTADDGRDQIAAVVSRGDDPEEKKRKRETVRSTGKLRTTVEKSSTFLPHGTTANRLVVRRTTLFHGPALADPSVGRLPTLIEFDVIARA